MKEKKGSFFLSIFVYLGEARTSRGKIVWMVRYKAWATEPPKDVALDRDKG